VKRFKLVVIGLDGATFDLLKPWAQEGRLPTLRKLLMEGTAGELQSTIPPMTAPAWTSFMTGKNPGKHGLYDWINRYQDSYKVFPITAQHCHEPTLWELLSDAGQRVCVCNVPMTYPPTPLNGVMVSGMPAPSTRLTITYPPDLLADIQREVGEYLLYPDPGQAYSDAGVDAFLDRLYRTTATRLKVVAYLRGLEDWDFFMLVLNGTDTVQHAMWKYSSPDHPLHEPRKFIKYGDAILDYFQYVDRALGEIVAGLNDDSVLLLMSDHGFGPFHKFIHVNNWLRQEGWLKIKRAPKSLAKSTLFDLGFAPMTIYNVLMSIGMGRFKREVVRGRGQSLLKTLFLSFDDVDWTTTSAYSLGNVGQIRLNVRGREPQGIVEPGEQYEAVRDEVIARLRELCDPETGEQVVQDIFLREDIYWGHNLEHAADIVFIPTRMEYFGFGEYEFGSNQIIERMKRGISGTHRLNGMFLMWGKPVKAGAWLEGTRILDLAPTILTLLAQPVPADMDGRVLIEALIPEYVAFQPEIGSVSAKTRSVPPSTPASSLPSDKLSDEDEELIVQRLRDLGYMA
jgi:predicted AlkP superfamily phosphohydrolase/phosphomutase